MQKLYLILFLLFICIINTTISANDFLNNPTYIKIKEINGFLDEDSYLDIIRSSLFKQPEFRYAIAKASEQEFNLKYAKRQRFPSISGNIINDESIDRNIKDNQSVRKRRDDSFDATIEIKQPVYNGGKINSAIRAAISRTKGSMVGKRTTISELILEANEIYLSTASINFISNYAQNLLNILKPYHSKVKDRVSSGIMDPVESALFFVRYSQLETLLYQLKSSAENYNKKYTLFFGNNPNNLTFPIINIEKSLINLNKKSYDVEVAEFNYEESKENIKNVRSDYLPSFGISARYTKYDIDDDSDEDDIRGGLYFSLPIFNFGRGTAQINSAKAASVGYKNAIDVAKKEDNVKESQILSNFNNAIDNRNNYLEAFNDTAMQRKIIQERIDISGFAANAFAEVTFNEINQLQTLLNNEGAILQGYMMIMHQNQQLINKLKIEF